MVKFIRSASVISAAAVLTLTSTAVSAQPASGEMIVINAPHYPAHDENTVVIQFRDLALDRQAGKNALMHRVGFAIDSLCGDSGASADPVGAMKCSNIAWNNVRPQLDQLLRR